MSDELRPLRKMRVDEQLALVRKLDADIGIDNATLGDLIDDILGRHKYGKGLPRGIGKVPEYLLPKMWRSRAAAEAIRAAGTLAKAKKTLCLEHTTSQARLRELLRVGDLQGLVDAFDLRIVTRDEHKLLDSNKAVVGPDRYKHHKVMP